ncbi:MAG TPA: PhzF family phenazine biosynthesis protein [Vicinamibacterales bacterium]
MMTRRRFGQTALAGAIGPMALQPASSPANRRRFTHLDVFTDVPFAGNQLLVFLEPAGLDANAMHTLTRESNYSECTFVFPPEQSGTDHRVRIFTRNGETPFAGHPTIGTAFALAAAGVIKPGTARSTFGLGVGPTPIDLDWNGSRLSFAWMTQLKPTFGKTIADLDSLSGALGLERASIAAERGAPGEVNCGSTFLIVPLATRKAVDAAVLDRAKVDAVFAAAGIQRRGVYVVSTESASDGVDAYTRLLGTGGIEDPATGSAAGPAACFLVRHGLVLAAAFGKLQFLQGVLVGRPSRIHANISVGARASDGVEIVGVKVGGRAVVVGDGSVDVPPQGRG